MHKLIVSAVCAVIFIVQSHAQTDSVRTKKFSHYVGVQANELMRQLFNFSESNTVVDNPYFLVYSISKSNGWGLHAGFGYQYDRIVDKLVPINRETKVEKFDFRVGAEKKFMLGKRFEGGISLDFVGSHALDKTTNVTVVTFGSQIDSSVTTVTDKVTGFGGGPQFSLSYHITEKILLGTEATMYYLKGKKKENVRVVNTVIDTFNNTVVNFNTSNFNSETDTDSFKRAIPVTLFLIVKF